ncbi:MAG: PEP-CTERM sorting domain-containing protein [Fimbriimonadaceae bacterium]
MKMIRLVRGLVQGIAFIALGCLPALGTSQVGFNVDLDTFSGSEETGGLAPSDAFAGAAGQIGRWNRIYAGGPSPAEPLLGLLGQETSATILATGGIGSYGGWGSVYNHNTGDVARLLNDVAVVGGEIQYHFSGIPQGRYLIYTYASSALSRVVEAKVTIPGAINPTQIVTGPMGYNLMEEGVTHSIHEVAVSGGRFDIIVSGPNLPNNTHVNGFQIVAIVPEPGTWFSVIGLTSLYLLNRRRR